MNELQMMVVVPNGQQAQLLMALCKAALSSGDLNMADLAVTVSKSIHVNDDVIGLVFPVPTPEEPEDVPVDNREPPVFEEEG